MKKYFLFSTLVLLSTASFAQFSRGTFLAGGNISFSHTSDKDGYGGNKLATYASETNISFLPQAGYFVINNLALGAGLGYTHYMSKFSNSSEKTTSTDKSFDPFARYYYRHFYGQFMYQLGSGNSENDGDGVYKSNYKLHGWQLSIGYAWMITDHVAVEPQIGYGKQYRHTDGGSDTDIYGGLFIQAGFQVYLHTQK